jgi:hypothetical protein
MPPREPSLLGTLVSHTHHLFVFWPNVLAISTYFIQYFISTYWLYHFWLHILKTFTKGGANSGGPPSKRPKISAPASSSKISTTIVQNLAESQSDLPLNYTLEAMTKKTPGVFHPFTRNPVSQLLWNAPGTTTTTTTHQTTTQQRNNQIAKNINTGSDYRSNNNQPHAMYVSCTTNN